MDNRDMHPGVTLQRDFIEPFHLTADRLAQIINVPRDQIQEICQGRRGISADTALRFERAFGISARFWLSLQQHYDLIDASRLAVGLHNIQLVEI